jgi:hypothetical protein
MVPNKNPPPRDRINAQNRRFMTAGGTVSMLVDPSCVHLINDFEGVLLMEDDDSQIDKDRDEWLTHLSDGIGYKIVRLYPVVTRDLEVEPFYG